MRNGHRRAAPERPRSRHLLLPPLPILGARQLGPGAKYPVIRPPAGTHSVVPRRLAALPITVRRGLDRLVFNHDIQALDIETGAQCRTSPTSAEAFYKGTMNE